LLWFVTRYTSTIELIHKNSNFSQQPKIKGDKVGSAEAKCKKNQGKDIEAQPKACGANANYANLMTN
jgi:hypothetical protein